MDFFKQVRAPLRLTKRVQEKCDATVFTDEELQHMRELLQEWFCESVGRVQLDWSVPPGQPFALHVLSKHVGDKDASLRPSLLGGVPGGVDGNMPRSHVFLPKTTGDPPEKDFLVRTGKWHQAEDNQQLLEQLVFAEFDARYIEEVENLAAAEARWPPRVAVGM